MHKFKNAIDAVRHGHVAQSKITHVLFSDSRAKEMPFILLTDKEFPASAKHPALKYIETFNINHFTFSKSIKNNDISDG